MQALVTGYSWLRLHVMPRTRSTPFIRFSLKFLLVSRHLSLWLLSSWSTLSAPRAQLGKWSNLVILHRDVSGLWGPLVIISACQSLVTRHWLGDFAILMSSWLVSTAVLGAVCLCIFFLYFPPSLSWCNAQGLCTLACRPQEHGQCGTQPESHWHGKGTSCHWDIPWVWKESLDLHFLEREPEACWLIESRRLWSQSQQAAELLSATWICFFCTETRGPWEILADGRTEYCWCSSGPAQWAAFLRTCLSSLWFHDFQTTTTTKSTCSLTWSTALLCLPLCHLCCGPPAPRWLAGTSPLA